MNEGDKLFKGLIITPVIINVINYSIHFLTEIFPPINDPAIWLKYAYALMGKSYPMWNITSLQYPPFFNLILAVLILITNNSIESVKILGIILIILLPLSSYPLAKRLGGKYAGLASIWIFSFHPSFAEMYGWGGYPNLLGLIFLLITVYFLVKLLDASSKKYMLYSVISSSLVILTHHLTTIICGILILAYLTIIIYYLISRERSISVLHIIPVLSFIATFIVWRLIAREFQYIIYNPASLYIRPFNYDAFWWIFKDPSTTILLFVTAVIGLYYLYIKKEYHVVSLLTIWIIFTFLFTQSYIFGIALDFRRFPIFSVPAVILSSVSTLGFVNSIRIFKKVDDKNYNIDIIRVFLVSLLISLIAVSYTHLTLPTTERV